MSFSSIASWLKAARESLLRGRPERRPARRPKRTCRPGLEMLEGRDVPATFTVTNLNDAGLGSLRQAITDANNLAGPDAIVFRPGLAGVITLTTGQLTVTGPVTITGPGSGALTVSGNNASRIFLIDDGTTAVQDVTITGLALTQGKVTGAFEVGGAIKVANENLSLNDMVIINNTAEGGGGGIAIGRTGRLTLENSTVSSNTVTSDGGGLWFDGLSVATIRDSSIVLNKTTGSGEGGGGIHVESDGFLTIDRTTIANNQTVLSGGGIDFFSGTLVVRNSTISGNSAGTGGGILIGGGSLTVENSTISGNSAKFDGGGIWMRGTTAAVRNSTIAFNTADSDNNGNGTQRGGGIFVLVGPPASALTLQSTLVAENFRGTGGTFEDVVGMVVGTSSNNLIGVDTGLTGINNGILGNLIGTAAAPINPLLAPLANNGGPTQTHALLAGSPAINAGFNFSGQITDQRGGAFLRSVGLTDIGAFEVQPPKPPAARPLTVTLEVVKKNHQRRLIIVVRFADTGEIKAQFNSPFNQPAFRRISVSLLDQNGDGVPDAVQVTALKAGPGKRLVTRILGF